MAKDKIKSNLHAGEQIIDYSFESLMGDRFGRYAKYIIQERALPDVRDGLKPVQRRILYGMKQLRLTFDKPYMKSARVVGDVMGKYHPHGDSSIYEALVRMSQDWKMGLPLIDMQGNNGSMDGDPAAAYRYTESRLEKVANFLLSDLDKETVEFSPNYDDKDIEPTVLPAYLPNILINGSTGIAAGYATNMPPHNLVEVINATIAMIQNPEIKLEKLMKHLKAPDFPTGGVLQQIDGVSDAFKTGKGKLVINSKWHEEPNKLVIDEIPYEVIKQDLVRKIGEVSDNNTGLGIKNIVDESDKTGLRVVIELGPKSNLETVRKFLFKNTPLSISYNYNNVVIINKQPKQVGLIDILKAYIDHYVDVYTKRTKYDLGKAKNRLEIIDGLVKAMSILDEVIAIIRKSENRKNAIENLVHEFHFSFVQGEAIVDMRLHRLTSTDIVLLHKEKTELEEVVVHYKKLLKDKAFLDQEIINNLEQIKKEYPIKRRSLISSENESFEVDVKDTIIEKTFSLFISRDGYLKAIDPTLFAKNEMQTFGRKPGDLFIANLEVSNMDHLLITSSSGQYYSIPLFKLANNKWRDFGTHVNEFAQMTSEEHLISALVVKDFKDLEQQLLITTKSGLIKRVLVADLETKTFNKPFRLMKLENGSDEVVSADLVTSKTHSVVVVNEKGYGVRYDLKDIPIQGTNSKGVKASSVSEKIVSGTPLDFTQNLLIITNKNRIKKISQKSIPMFIRPKKGSRLFPETSTHPKETIMFGFSVNENSILNIINQSNECVEIPVKGIKMNDLTTKPDSIGIKNLVEASLNNIYVTDNLDKLNSTTDYLTKNNLTLSSNEEVKPVITTQKANEKVELKSEELKSEIDKKYDNDLYSMFDSVDHLKKTNDTETKVIDDEKEKEDETNLEINLEDLLGD